MTYNLNAYKGFSIKRAWSLHVGEIFAKWDHRPIMYVCSMTSFKWPPQLRLVARNTKGPIFYDSGAQIGLYMIDGVAYVHFEGIGSLLLVGIELRPKKTAQEKAQRG